MDSTSNAADVKLANELISSQCLSEAPIEAVKVSAILVNGKDADTYAEFNEVINNLRMNVPAALLPGWDHILYMEQRLAKDDISPTNEFKDALAMVISYNRKIEYDLNKSLENYYSTIFDIGLSIYEETTDLNKEAQAFSDLYQPIFHDINEVADDNSSLDFFSEHLNSIQVEAISHSNWDFEDYNELCDMYSLYPTVESFPLESNYSRLCKLIGSFLATMVIKKDAEQNGPGFREKFLEQQVSKFDLEMNMSVIEVIYDSIRAS